MIEKPQTDKLNPENLPEARNPIRVLIVEDSATVRYHLRGIIEEIPGMYVVGQASNGERALTLVQQLKPDVISMDVSMPLMDGLEATEHIMSAFPTPVVIVSSLIETDVQLAFKALEAGAVAVVEKPPHRDNPTFITKRNNLVKTLAAMAGVSVVRRKRRLTDRLIPDDSTDRKQPTNRPQVIAIGASAGGPSALSKLLRALPADLPVPIVIVQHIPQEFIEGLAGWLDQISPLAVRLATNGLVLEPGVVNLSPGGVHLRVIKRNNTLTAQLDPEPIYALYQPSVDVLFESVAASCGANAIGIVLTGMGTDGAQGLAVMREKGALTFAQDRASATVYGMPGAAIAQNAVGQVLSLGALPSAILKSLE